MDDKLLENWEVKERELVADLSPVLKLYRETIYIDEETTVDDFFTIERPDFIVIFPLLEEDSILGIRKYKHGSRKIDLELPTGPIFPGESALSAAKRELLEVTGYSARDWSSFGPFSVDGNRGCGNVHFFKATELQIERTPNPDGLEEFTVECISLDDLDDYLQNGQISSLVAATGIFFGLLANNQGNNYSPTPED
jgi:ADP-ribose pyrophosphatase